MPAIYPAFQVPIPDEQNFNGRSLSHNLEILDGIATSLQLATLSGRIDARTMALELLDEDQLPANCPPVRWYSAQEGVRSVQALMSHLEQHPELLPEARAAILADLESLLRLLEEAHRQNIGYHLLVDL